MLAFHVSCSTQEFPGSKFSAPPTGMNSKPTPESALAGSGRLPAAAADPFREIVNQVKEIVKKSNVAQEPYKTLLGEITYQNTEFASPISVSIKEWLRQELHRADEIVLLEAPRLRGLEVVEKPKTTASLAEMVGADIWLTGEYWKSASGLELRVLVTERRGDLLIGVAKASLPSGLIPLGMNVIPANLAAAQANQQIEARIAPLTGSETDNPLKLEVWTDRGKGSVYIEGDELFVMIRANMDAYVRLYYTDAANQTYQIFPNRYRSEGKISGNAVVRIPDPQDAFAFRIKPPFGVESITALASRTPLEDLNVPSLTAGPFQRLAEGLRGLEVASAAFRKDRIVRDSFVLTTIPLTGTTDSSWD